MKIYVLVFCIDFSQSTGEIEEFVQVSRDYDVLERVKIDGNTYIDENWDEDDLEWNGSSLSSKPYYQIKEFEV